MFASIVFRFVQESSGQSVCSVAYLACAMHFFSFASFTLHDSNLGRRSRSSSSQRRVDGRTQLGPGPTRRTQLGEAGTLQTHI